jgi:hypothetical protein
MAGQASTKSLQACSDDYLFECFDISTNGIVDEYNTPEWLSTWPAPWPPSPSYPSQFLISDPEPTPTTAAYHTYAPTSGYPGDTGSYITLSAIESRLSCIEPGLSSQDVNLVKGLSGKTTLSNTRKRCAPTRRSPTTPQHARRKSLKRKHEFPEPLPPIPEEVDDEDGGDHHDPAIDDNDKAAAEKLRRIRSIEATKKSQHKKKKHVEGLKRYEQQLSAQWNHLREERETLHSEALWLRQMILQHRNCGFDLTDAYIKVSDRRMAMEGREAVRFELADNTGSDRDHTWSSQKTR